MEFKDYKEKQQYYKKLNKQKRIISKAGKDYVYPEEAKQNLEILIPQNLVNDIITEAQKNVDYIFKKIPQMSKGKII